MNLHEQNRMRELAGLKPLTESRINSEKKLLNESGFEDINFLIFEFDEEFNTPSKGLDEFDEDEVYKMQ